MSWIDDLRTALYGDPPDPNHEPSREGLLAALTESRSEYLEGIGNSAIAGMTDVAYATKAEIDADLDHAENSVGLVYADATDANNDLYVKVGASGAGSWTLTTILHDLIGGLLADTLTDLADAVAEVGLVESRVADLELNLMDEVGELYEFGNVDDVEGSTVSNAVGSANVVPDQPASVAMTGRRIEINAFAAGTANVIVFTKSGANFSVHDQVSLSCGIGYNDFYFDLDIPAGAYVGFRGSGVIGRVAATGATYDQYTGGGTNGFTDSDGLATNDSIYAVKVTASSSVPKVVASESSASSASAPHRGVIKEALLTSAATCFFMGGNGQSEMAGPAGSTEQTTRAEYGAKGFQNNDDTIFDLSTTATGGTERPIFGMAAYLRERLMMEGLASNIAGDRPVIAGSNAHGGEPLVELLEGATVDYYTQGIDQITAAETYATGISADFYHLGRAFYHGPADASAGTTRATYKTTLIAHNLNYDTDAKAADGASHDRITAIAQVCAKNSSVALANVWAIAQAQFEAARDDPLTILAFPEYMLDFYDDLHPTGESQRIAGAYFARALMMEAWEPLWVVDSYITATAIVLVYNRPVQLDTTLIPFQSSYGFEVADGASSPVTINTVSVDGRRVTLEIGIDPTGYSWTYGYMSAVGKGTYLGLCGNLRDNAGDNDTFDDYPLHNWAVVQEGSV